MADALPRGDHDHHSAVCTAVRSREMRFTMVIDTLYSWSRCVLLRLGAMGGHANGRMNAMIAGMAKDSRLHNTVGLTMLCRPYATQEQ